MNQQQNKSKLGFLKPLGLSLLVCILSSCSLMSTYDQQSYEKVTSLKVDAKNLMGLATQSYRGKQTELKAFQEKIEKAYEYDLGRPKNTLTMKLWDKLLNPSGDLLGGFLAEWKAEDQLLPAYISDKQIQIGRGFDMIRGLESGKVKSSDANKYLE